MDRITDKMLEGRALRLNKLTGSPLTYARVDDNGRRIINVGHFHIDYAYGGVQLVRTCNEGGGVSTPLVAGHLKRRELWGLINAFIDGIEWQKENS